MSIWWIVSHATWILGLSILLASWSFGYYEARSKGQSLLELMARPGYDLAIAAGTVIFLAGLAAADARLLARLLWLTLALTTLVFFARSRRKPAPKSKPPDAFPQDPS